MMPPSKDPVSNQEILSSSSRLKAAGCRCNQAMSPCLMNVKIVRRPVGEAPEWVRDAWIGLSLPLASDRQRQWRGFGVLSGPNNLFLQMWALVSGKGVKVDGYCVNAQIAVALLGEMQPEAAEWWREHTPALFDGRSNFVFDADACERE